MSWPGENILSESDQEAIHNAAIEVLWRGGLIIEDDRLVERIRKRGGAGEAGSNRIQLPAELIAECLECVGKEPVLTTIGGKRLHLYGNNRYYLSLTIDPSVFEYNVGFRKPVVEDVARHARLGDALPKIDVMYKMDQECSDAPGLLSDLGTLEAFVANTTTAYFCAPASMESARRWVGVAEIMAGGSLNENPVLMGYVAIISPLKLNKEATDMMRFFIESGVLLRVGPCPIAGATSPFPLAGTLVQGWAEVLAQIVVSQIIKEGTPVVACLGASVLDMETGVCVYGGPMHDMMKAASVLMTNRFGLSSSGGKFSTVCSNHGLQNGVEVAISAVYNFGLPVHLTAGMGTVANACGVSAINILLDNNLVESLERMRRGIDCSPEKLSIESIIAKGKGGDYLTDDLTLKYLRTDEHFWTADFFHGKAGSDQTTLFDNLHTRAEALIAEHKPEVPQERVEKARRFLFKKKRGE